MIFFTRRGKAGARGPELLDNFADNPWETIIWACQTGNVPESWTVGSQKPMPINGKDYPVDIIGLYHDDYSDGSGKAPITFQMHDCYGTAYGMNGSNTNSGGWTSCAIRNTHLPAILGTMPGAIQTAIKEVNKLTSAGGGSTTIVTTADKLFLLSAVEIIGSPSYSAAGEGTQYAYYAAGNSRVKKINGSQCTWWERSPFISGLTGFCAVYQNGDLTAVVSTQSNGVAFAFCF